MSNHRSRKGQDLQERLILFAARVVNVADALPHTAAATHVAGQLIRSGTAPASCYAEARGAESRNDFVHKLGICEKELRETKCWLQFLVHASLLSADRLSALLDENEQLIAIIAKSIATAKSRSASSAQTKRKKRKNQADE